MKFSVTSLIIAMSLPAHKSPKVIEMLY